VIYNWMKLPDNCPLNLLELCKIGWDLQVDLQRAKRGKNRDNAFYMRTKLNRIIRLFLGILSRENGNEKEDKQVEIEFNEAYSRILANLDKKEDEMKSASKIDAVALPLYISEIESILIGDVYDTIRIASETYPKDRKMFKLKAFELVNKSSLVFGGEARFKPARGLKPNLGIDMMAKTPSLSAEELATEDGKKMMRKKFENNFPDFEVLKNESH